MKDVKTAERLGRLLSNARIESGVSQEKIAMALGISKSTVRNFESGTSQPNVIQAYDWFIYLGKNPTQYMLQFYNPDQFENMSPNDSDEKIENALEIMIHSLTMRQKRGILYWWYGSHNSDPNSVLQLLLAHLHTPLVNRVNIAHNVINNYEICEKCGTLVDTQNISPDIELLHIATNLAKEAVMSGQDGYGVNIY